VANQEQAVRDAHLIEAIVEYSEDAVIGSTLAGIIASWNPAAARMYGYSSQEIVGRSGSLLVPDQGDEFLDTVAKIEGGKAVEHFETTRVRKDGSVVPVSLTVAPIHDSGGTIIGTAAVHRDVTEQRRAFELAQRMEAIVQGSDDAIIAMTLGGIITSWNPAAEMMYGYSSPEMIGQSADRLVPEDRMGEIRAVVAKVRAGQSVERLQTVRVRKGGEAFPASVVISPILDAGGAIIGESAIHRDVTEHRRAFDLAQRMEAIVQGSDDAIFALTLQGVITSWNRAAEKLFGYTSEEIIGKPAETVTPRDRPEEMTSILAKVGAGEHIDHLETVRVRKDGTVFPVSLTVSPICDPDGVVVGTSMISRNMVELKEAERYARGLIEAGLDPLVTISPAGKITDVNEAAVKATGVAREGLIGTDFSAYVTEPDKAREGYQQAFEQGSITDYPLTLIHQDGTLSDMLYNATVYRDFNEHVVGVLAVARDAAKLREQQQLSEQLQQALASRIVIEQAKGITAQRHGVTIDQAYQLIRTHARRHHTSLRMVAEAIVQVRLEV